MRRCVSCFGPLAAGELCAICANLVRSESALSLGVTLRDDRYRIGRTLGDPGGFGVTYLAWDSSLERRVAIKEYFPRHFATRTKAESGPNPTSGSAADDFKAGLRGFLDEARRLARLDHPNVVKAHDYCEANGTGYLVMSYYEGRDLREYVRGAGNRLDWREVVGIALPLLDGLDDVHRAGLIHRDIKPANVYLATLSDDKFRPILIDFGAARWATTTHELTAILTEGFAPLEQYPGCGPQSACTDVYATAATMYAVIAGRVPASAPSRLTHAYVAHLTDQVPGVPRRLGDVIEHAMAIQAEERPQSSAEFARGIRAAIGAPASRAAGPSSQVIRDASAYHADAGPAEAAGRRSIPQTQLNAATATTEIMDQARASRRLMSAKVVAGLAGSLLVIGAASVGVTNWKANRASAAADRPPGGSASDSTPSGPAQAPVASTRNAAPAAGDGEADRITGMATSALAAGEYAAAMTSAASLRALSLRAGVPPQVATKWRRSADSLAAVILSACPAEREMSARRGVVLPPCPAKGW